MDVDLSVDNASNLLKRIIDDSHDNHSRTASDIALSETTMPTPPHSSNEGEKIHAMSPLSFHRAISPALSLSSLSSLPTSTTGSTIVLNSVPTLDGTSEPPRKRRKLTPAEKLQQVHDRAEKQRQQEERKAQKEAQDAVRAEERRRKNEEREIKQREHDLLKQQKEEERRQKREQKEEEKRQKEEEKRQREEEAEKKQRSQLKLASFFVKSTPVKPRTERPTDTPMDEISPNDLTSADVQSASQQEATKHGADFRRFFLPFQVPQHTTLVERASHNEDNSRNFDNAVSVTVARAPIDKISHMRLSFGTASERTRLPPKAARIREHVDGTSQAPVDLTKDGCDSVAQELQQIHMKHIQFSEDVRPPYTGSYTQVADILQARRMARAPLRRLRHDTNYEYDSEAEWEEPEDGEDVLSEDEEDNESVGTAGSGEEMNEFLDDEDTQVARRKLITSELEPLSSGLCWESNSPRKRKDTAKDSSFDLTAMRIEFLFADRSISSIDPFSRSYWAMPSTATTTTTVASASAPSKKLDLFGNLVPISSDGGSMKPPRAPLHPATNGTNQNIVAAINVAEGAKGPIMKSEKPRVALVGQDFELLKEAVVGSDLPKMELLKALKIRFPKLTNDTIKHTISTNFARTGEKSAKTWQLSHE